MIGQTISHYRIVEKLGEGGMGVVYKAEDTALERPVALKFLANHLLNDVEAKERFLREAKSAAALHHPNVCPVYEIAEADGKTFLAMAFLEGETLEDRIAKGPLPLKDALDIGRQVAEGLQAAHSSGVVHRDIKPANILISPDRRATILDFGLARLTEASKLTRADQTVGTAAYMSPEQIQGVEVDQRTDIWALGCVLYEMVTGLRPFKGQYDQALAYEIVQEEPEPLTGVRAGLPMELEFIVGKCLAKAAPDRYGSAVELAKDLRTLGEKMRSGRSRAMSAATITASPRSPHQEQPPGLRKRPQLAWVLFAATALASLALTSALLTQPKQERRVRRFSVTPESLSSWTAAISPDGRWIVYGSSDEPSSLWLRAIDDEEPRRLEGTEGAAIYPFWSPDSQDVAFAVNGELKKVAIHGGSPIFLCRVPGNFYINGAWSPDGKTIVFSADTRGAGPRLYEIPSTGGEPRVLIEQIEGARSDEFVSPMFFPDPAVPALVFEVGPRTRKDIYLWNRESRTSKMLVEEANVGTYSSSGVLLYVPSGARRDLWALPFSAYSLQATGEPFPVALGAESPSVSEDGTLVYVDSVRDRQQLVWRDRAGRKIGLAGRPLEEIRWPQLSPDGRQALVRGMDDVAREIWIHDADRAVAQRVSTAEATPQFVSWSPDGKSIAYSDSQDWGIFLRPADGDGPSERLVPASYHPQSFDWSPNGRYIMFSSLSAETNNDLWLLDRQTSDDGDQIKPFVRTPGYEGVPQISPVGNQVAYCSDESGVVQVYVRDFPAGTNRRQISEDGGCQPRWSPDGSELFYGRDDMLMVSRIQGGSGPETRPTALFPAPGQLQSKGWQYDVAPDGRFLMVEDVVDEAGGTRKRAIHVVENWYEEFRDRE